jgi:hypothetical protein
MSGGNRRIFRDDIGGHGPSNLSFRDPYRYLRHRADPLTFPPPTPEAIPQHLTQVKAPQLAIDLPLIISHHHNSPYTSLHQGRNL